MSEVAGKLRAARDLISRPGGWTQHTAARDAVGNRTLPLYIDAVCFCAIGAMSRSGCLESARDVFSRAVAAIASGWNDIASWNDDPTRTQAEVVDAFSKAIALAEAEATP